MQLKCSEYFKEAIRTNNEQQRNALMSKACKQISQLLPFQQMWPLLLKQDQILFYMLILQSSFGQNIRMLLELIIERFTSLQQFQLLFLNACQQTFRQDYSMMATFLTKRLPNIHMECIVQLQCFIKHIPKNEVTEFIPVAQQIINTYKTIFENIHPSEKQQIQDIYGSLQYVVRKWNIIQQINPLVFHEIEDIISNKQVGNYEVAVVSEEYTECESPTKSYSIRKDNQIVVELQRWLSRFNFPVPVISKKIGSGVINSQNIFKLNDNIEILLSFIFSPLKYDTSDIWSKQEAPIKVGLRDIPNLKDAVNLRHPAAHYHLRTIRTLQCLTDEENHVIICKVNPKYLSIAFTYLNSCYQDDYCKFMNYNYCCLLLQFYLEKEQDITVYYCLHYNIQHMLLLNFQYELVGSFLIHLLVEMNPYQSQRNVKHQLQRECWKYFQASNFFQDLASYILHQKNHEDIQDKCNEDYRTQEMTQSLYIQPDLVPRDHNIINTLDQMTYVIEEKHHLAQDIDGLKPFIQKKTIKSLRFFNKVQSKVLTGNMKQELTFMDAVRQAIEIASGMENSSPIKKRKVQRRCTIDTGKVIILRRATRIFNFTDDMQSQPSMDEIITVPEIKEIPFDKRSLHDKRSVSQCTAHNVKKRTSLFYPLSLQEKHNSRFDVEQKNECYFMEHLIKHEVASYNGVQFFSVLIQQLVHYEQSYITSRKMDQSRWQSCLTMILGNDRGIFETLIKQSLIVSEIYLFKLKLTSHIKENSALICGKLVNFILLHKSAYCNLTQNAIKYLNALTKLLITSCTWSNSISVDIAKITICESIILIIEIQLKNNDQSIINYITPTTWSCLIELLKEATIHKNNQIFQSLFVRLLTLVLEHGNDVNYYTLFMKLNLLASIKNIADMIVSTNLVPNPLYIHLQSFIQMLLTKIHHYINKNISRDTCKNINSLCTWVTLKQQFNLTINQHNSSFYSTIDNTKSQNNISNANISQSMARIRIRKSNYSTGKSLGIN